MRQSAIEDVRELWCKADRAIARAEMAASNALEDKCYANDDEKAELLSFIEMFDKFYAIIEGN